MRRARIQVKPSLNLRTARSTSESNVETSKENGTPAKSAEEGTSGSAPAAVETNSSTPPSATKLNFRRSAFSVRPKPTLRGLGVPNLHGTQPPPIVVSPASQSKETGDSAESVVKETNKTDEPVVSVPVPLNVKEDSAVTQEKVQLIEDKSGDTDKNTSKDKDLFQRRSRFQVKPKLQSKPSVLSSTTSVQPPEHQDVKENMAVSGNVPKEVQENKPNLPSDETNKTSKSIPVTKSQSLPCPKPDNKTAKSLTTESSANHEVDTSVLPTAVGTDEATSSKTLKETADKERLPETNSDTISKPSTIPQENPDKLLQKPETTTTIVKTTEPCTKIPSNNETKTQNNSDGVEAAKQKDESTEIKPVSVRRSRFSVQPKLGVKAPNRKPTTTTSQPQEKTTEDDAKDIPSKETAASSDSNKNESQSDPASVPQRSKFQVQPKLNLRGRMPLSSRLTSVDIQSDSQASQGVTNTQGSECTNNMDQPVAAVKEKEVEENIDTSVKATSESQITVLPRRSRFQVKPKPSLKTVEQPASASKKTEENLSTSQSVITEDSSISTQEDCSKEKEDSGNQATNKDGEASSKEMAPKIENPILPRRSRFQIQPKPRAKAASSQSSTSSSSSQPVTPESTRDTAVSSKTDDNKQKDDSKNKDDKISKETDGKIETTILPRRSRFQAQPKPRAKTAGQSSASTTKPSETPSISTEDGNKEKDESTIKVTNKDSDATTDKETISTVKEVPTVSRRMRFAARPKLGVSQPKNELPSAPVEEKISDETSKASNEITSTGEMSSLPRRNRFQIQPKPSAKTTKQSSPTPTNPPTVKTSTSPEEKTILETDDSKRNEETENKDAEATTNELPLKREQIPLPTLSRRSRFQVQPKVRLSQSKENQQSPSVDEEKAKTSSENSGKSETTVLPRRNRFQIQPKPNAKTTAEQSSTTTDSKKTVTDNDIPSTGVESVTSDAATKGTNDSENKDDDTSKTEKTAAPTLPRRSRFQVRPKLGLSKEPPKSPGKSNEAREKGIERPHPKSVTPDASKDAKRRKVDRQSTSPQTATTQDDLNSESSKASEKSFTDSSVSTSPVKSSGKSSISSPLKDNIQIENIKQREYPVNVRKSGKSGKSLPLREKQKKPDITEHPSDKPPDRAKMTMRDLIYWNPTSSPMKSPEAKRARPIRQEEEPAPKAPEPPPANENEPIAVPQVKIGADGNIVLNEESLVINNSQPTVPISMEVVDETDVYSNYGSFRKYSPKSKWSLKETKKFFLALSTVGTDFSLMTNLFSKKSRRDLKNKFKREERNNRWLVDKAIKQQLHFDEKLFEESSESEEEVQPPTKKSRQKKDPSEPRKKKEPKPRKTKKTTQADSSSTQNKAKKTKKITSKDWVIDSQEDEDEEDIVEETEEVVEEEPVQDEMLIIQENTPFCEDTAARSQPDAENQAKSVKTKVRKKAVKAKDQTQEEEVVGILMDMGKKDFASKPKSNMPSCASKSPRNKAPAPMMPMINTHSAAAAVASKKSEVAGKAKSTQRDVSIPGSSRTAAKGGAAESVTPATEEAQDSSSLARLFLQQMGLSSQMNALKDEIVSITEAEISHNDEKQKVILVEVQPKDQKQTVVHMYLVSRSEGAQSSADGSGGQVTVSEAQPLALPPSMSSLSDAPPDDANIASATTPLAPASASCTAPVPASCTAPAPVPASCTAPAPVPASCTAPAPVPASCTAPAPVPASCTAPAPVPASCTAPAPVPASCTAPAPVPASCTAPAPVPASCTAPAPVPASSPAPASNPMLISASSPAPASNPMLISASSPAPATSPAPVSNPMLMPATSPAPAPVSNPMLMPASRLAPAPVSNPMLQSTLSPTPVQAPNLMLQSTLSPTPVQAPNLMSVPASMPAPAPNPMLMPASRPAPAPVSNPLLLPTSSPTPVPAPNPMSMPASRPAPAPVSNPLLLPTLSPTPVPAPNPMSVPASRPAPAPNPMLLPASRPAPAPVSNPMLLPTLSPTPVQAPNPMSVPASSPAPVPNPMVLPASRPAPAPVSNPLLLPASRPAPAPVSNPLLLPASSPTPVQAPNPMSVPASSPAPVPNPMFLPASRPAPAPVSNPMLLPASSPAPAPNPILLPVSSPAPAPAPKLILLPASSPVLAPASCPAPNPAPASSPMLAPASNPVPAPDIPTSTAS